MVRRIRSLLYEQGFTIGGARQQLREARQERVEPPAQALPPASPVGAASASKSKKEQIKDLRRELEELLKRLPG
jgi:hypothetical protein